MRKINNFKKVTDLVKKEDIEFVDFKIVDLLGFWRHITISASNFSKEILKTGIGFDGSNYGYSSVHESDLLLIPDLTSPVVIENFFQNKCLSMSCDIYKVENGNKKGFEASPRRTARQAINYLKESEIANECKFSPEFEFYVFDDVEEDYRSDSINFNAPAQRSFDKRIKSERWGSLDSRTGYHLAPPSDQTFDLRNTVIKFLENQGIKTKYHHHETGCKGQAEIEIGFSNLLRICDLTMLIKYSTRNLARKMGKSATFMPKPLPKNPGNGMHLHQYLVKENENIFTGSEYSGLSPIALSYIRGLLKHGESLMAFTNPSTNSYRRLVPGYEAPTDLVYSRANRSAAIRIPGYVQHDSKKRIELRTIDGSCNPYLAFSAILMAGINGIEENPDTSEYKFGPVDKNIYELPPEERSKFKSTPHSLKTALTALKKDHDYLLKGGVFNEEQIKNWINVKRKELRGVANRPHPHEYDLYYSF